MLVIRKPVPSLQPFVALIWALDETATATPRPAPRERVLPTGSAHLAIRLSDTPLRIYQSMDDAVGRTLGHAVIGGPRDAFYVRDVSTPSISAGVQLLPGALALLAGVPASELAGRHTPLGDLWGSAAARIRERLLEAEGPARRLEVLEAVLAERLPRVRAVHPAVAHALGRLAAGAAVGEVVEECGYSHRRFIDLFRGAVGLTPKGFSRVERFRRLLSRFGAAPVEKLAELAIDAGFSDQPHFNRDFRTMAGISPGRYREIAPAYAHHVPIDARGR